MPRIEAARQRAGAMKRALAVLAAVGLVGAGLLARATNPGHATRATRSSGASSSATSSDSQSESSDDGFSVTPSASQPQVQTHVS
jgi:hypothetical protein